MPRDLEAAVEHLRSNDAVMRSLIDEIGPCNMRRERNRFWMLVGSIISQQLSTTTARTIRLRLENLAGDCTPEAIVQLSVLDYRGIGLSTQKANYIIQLGQAVLDDRLDLSQIGRKTDESAIALLTQLKGVGHWTAQMFLIFSLGRLDVLPIADQGIRTAMRKYYCLDELPDGPTITKLAEPWRPFASVASWYCWRAIDQRITTLS